ncbi:MAG: D-alanyl-D-alanine carboxypeptidase/D-alanyl-D-alanine-endopeptidase [Gemmatimonadetes bacterium]|nr:D-alanyl-D-alanine carboxypeptidase/D-alanyl-D-alanine-endopeptidase [Gemmatimonadota bacterium]
MRLELNWHRVARCAPAAAILLLGGCRAPAGGAPAPAGDVRVLRASLDSMLREPKYANASLGVLVVDPTQGDTLLSHNAGKLFMPASNQKLLTGAVALTQLGPDFRFSTTVYADGPIVDGELRGQLRVVGTGDPSISDAMARDAMAPLRAMADSLAARGIRRITQGLRPGGDAFPDAAWGFGWSWDDTDFPYSAGVDELYLNEGYLAVRVWGSAPGTAPRVRVAPNATFPRVRLDARSVARGDSIPRARRLRVEHDSADATLIVVSGEIAAGDSSTLELSHRDNPRTFLEAFATALRERGIAVEGPITTQRPTPQVGREPMGTALFSWVSPQLAEVLPAFEKPSQNQIGEILLKTLGRSKAGVGSADSGARVVRDQLLAWGARADGFVVRDGSGLSRYNVVSPETIIRVLDAMRTGPHSALFHRSLPIAGVDGTVRNRMRGTAAANNVHAKTGTLNMVRSLSGYVTTAGGRPLLFSLLANHFTVPTRDIDALHEAIVVRLTALR